MINLIVAIGKNNLIGKDNDLPWHYKEDLQYFKQTTLNKTVVMGENTFYSIFSRTNKLLPNRKMVVATFNKDFKHEGVEVIHDLEKYLKETKEDVLDFLLTRKVLVKLEGRFEEYVKNSLKQLYFSLKPSVSISILYFSINGIISFFDLGEF